MSFLADAWYTMKVQPGCIFDLCAVKFKPVHNYIRDRSRCYDGWLLSGELEVHHSMLADRKDCVSRYLCQRGLSSAQSPFSPGQMGFTEKAPPQHNAGCVGFSVCLSFAPIPHWWLWRAKDPVRTTHLATPAYHRAPAKAGWMLIERRSQKCLKSWPASGLH